MKTIWLWLFLLSPGLLLASSTGALRDYKAGKYDQALKDYQQLLDRKGDDPRLHFNAGAAAYRDQQLDEAAKQFDEALKSPDLKLQEQAYYNRGNTLFYQGEQNPDPAKRTETWKKALQDFESSMKLAPQDADAKFNHDLVKKRLEELQQQQQQQKSDQNKDDKQDQDQQKQQQQNQQSKDDQQKQDQQKQQDQQNQQKQDQQKQGSSKQDQQKQDQQKQDQQQAQQQQQQAAKSEEQKQKEQQAAKPEEDKNQPSEEEKQEAAAAAAGEMTQKQAAQLLDAQKGNEQMMPSKPRKPTERTKPLKDW